MTQEEKREAMERENAKGAAGMEGQGEIDGIGNMRQDAGEELWNGRDAAVGEMGNGTEAAGISRDGQQDGSESGMEGMSQEEAEAAVAWIAEDAQLDAELEALMNEDTSGKKNKKKAKKAKKKENAGKKKFFNWSAWSRKRKIITACVAVLGVVAVLKIFGGSGKNNVMPVSTTPVALGSVTEDLTVSGPISGTDSVDVVSNLHAEVTEILIKEGDRVEKGQLLALIDTSEIQKEVDIAQNAYDLAVTTYEEQQIQAENGYAKALQDYEAAKGEYERTNVLYHAGSVSRVEWETARNNMNDAQRAIKTFNLVDGKAVANESYSLQIKNAEFELEKKKEQLEDCQVVSPIAGTVTRVNVKVGRFADKIDDDRPMFIIENLDVLEMKIEISEYSIGKVAVGQEVEISADILGEDTVKGAVTAISPTGEEKSSGGSTERVIPTTIRIQDKDTKLIAGITARAKIVLNEADQVLVVPISAVLESEEGTYVLAVENNVLKKVLVNTGVESDIQMEVSPVEEGALTEGMEIVSAPSLALTEGMQVVAMPSM